jgi:hypothetical protein
MLRLLSALTIAAALAFAGTPGMAKEIKGAPKELIGAFGRNALECRSYQRKAGENIILIGPYEGADFYSDCGGRQCNATVLSHRRIRSGFALALRYESPYSIWTETLFAIRAGEGRYKFHFGGEPQNYMRCSRKDIIDGIGLPIYDEPMSNSEINFPYYYAIAIPALCDKLEAQVTLTPDLNTWEERGIREMARMAAISDKSEIPNFCVEVLRAFGRDGRVYPNLLIVRD